MNDMERGYVAELEQRCRNLEAELATTKAELAEAKKYEAAFHRELRDLQHEVAKACQASGTMLTDLQPEAMTIVLEICRAWPEAQQDSERLDYLETYDHLEWSFLPNHDACPSLRAAIDAAREGDGNG